jgi:hypothetical protein
VSTLRDSLRRLAALAVLAIGSGCAIGGGAAPTPETPAQPYVAIRPEDARLILAANDLTARFGHDVTYEVDADVLKDHAPNLQVELADAFETIARVLEQARVERPELVTKVYAVVTKIRVELDEKTRDHRAFVADDTLVLRVPTNAAGFATDAAVLAAIDAMQ